MGRNTVGLTIRPVKSMQHGSDMALDVLVIDVHLTWPPFWFQMFSGSVDVYGSWLVRRWSMYDINP